MKKSKIFLILSVVILLFVGLTSIGIGEKKYLDKEYEVQKLVIDTFDLKINDLKDNGNLKPLFMRDIYDDDIAKESPETRRKVTRAIDILSQENEIANGDFKPMIFLKGNNRVLIAVLHPNNTITLTEFDISKEKPEKIDKQVKEGKINEKK